ncbi:ActS/PrrB/RegB family redox-sensitive histidine kinase [Shimia sp. R9_1]|uniref:sensor histidine kinase RegB n=1 Tax=unclassified Shimia TaxID=2630038 RepID=UPI001ADC6F87|nr:MULTISPECIES: ActS/PrrB/RegB family redox-sensitive histidine kinase [unclassified Shimia]MBO9395315.1 ActS/PrrB/RegB family redox-sensitive histidine kinase [Shimia sp. R9_2]MBO9399465.1 ActS/PrrB/RegB family redox-sensitive histidine kinase [Shimia sp. R9_3]MBO9407320.1 ActS/PrrB/RegB family redox-sensitive histidine kinase [Shimia sp. R9_1]
MTDLSGELLSANRRSNWIRLRTFIALRWIAIAGQIVALLVAQFGFGLVLEYGLCYLAVGISVIGNLVAIFVFPENKLLTESENRYMLLFDVLQLGFLLFLTGGLHNPFAFLVVAPVTIAASVLSLRSAVTLAALAVIIVTALLEFHLPLRTQNFFILQVSDVFLFGNWAAIVIAISFSSFYSRQVVTEMSSMAEALAATQMALAREQKLTDLGGVVAAAAHELGTPLATIKLASAELFEELDDRPDLREDAALIREQTDRCRDILRSMGRAGKDDLHLRKAPLSTVIEEAAEPHMDRGKEIIFDHFEIVDGPEILRRPEIIHGLRNLIQNAVDFARENVWVETEWDETSIYLRILDDGPGYPPHLIGRIGDPFMRHRKPEKERKKRPGYEGMGLGLFIAKTLLERSGAEISFANGSKVIEEGRFTTARSGAVVEVIWPRQKIEANLNLNLVGSGENPVHQT